MEGVRRAQQLHRKARRTVPGQPWKPIQPLLPEERSIDLADLPPLYNSWRAMRSRLQHESPDSLNRFSERLIRSQSIETGILERLYDLDVGTTETLILQGFAEELVSRTSTNIEPSLLIDILRDQEAAVRLVIDCVAQRRTLTKGAGAGPRPRPMPASPPRRCR